MDNPSEEINLHVCRHLCICTLIDIEFVEASGNYGKKSLSESQKELSSDVASDTCQLWVSEQVT